MEVSFTFVLKYLQLAYHIEFILRQYGDDLEITR